MCLLVIVCGMDDVAAVYVEWLMLQLFMWND